MITKVAVGNFDLRKSFLNYPYDQDRPMSKQQRKTLIELINDRIYSPDEIQRQITQIEEYNFADAEEAIQDFLLSPWK